MREVAKIEAAIKETTSMLNSRRSALSDYEDEYNSAVKNGDEDLASHWKSQMRSVENRISELEGILADEQAELKSAQEASSNTDDSDPNSTISSGSNSTISNGTATASTVSANYYVCAGGDQVISNYAGEQIMLGTVSITPLNLGRRHK